MTKLKLLTTTAIFVGVVTMASVSKAEGETSWLDTMTQSVQGWFGSKTSETSSEVEMYLDEVTIAVPPVSSDITEIEPAAGDYQETLEDTMDKMDEQSFNTEFNTPSAVLSAFGENIDNMSPVDDLANIMPAAGDEAPVEEVKEVVEEVVAVEEEPSMMEKATDMASDMVDATMETASEAAEVVSETTSDAVDGAMDMAKDAMEASSDMVDGAVESVSDMSADVMEAVEPAASEEVMTREVEMESNAVVEETMDKAMDAVEGKTY